MPAGVGALVQRLVPLDDAAQPSIGEGLVGLAGEVLGAEQDTPALEVLDSADGAGDVADEQVCVVLRVGGVDQLDDAGIAGQH